jgi:hypothetical protein
LLRRGANSRSRESAARRATGDQNISYQQNLGGRRLAIVALSAIDFDILKSNLSLIVTAIDNASPGSCLAVECGRFVKQRRGPE